MSEIILSIKLDDASGAQAYLADFKETSRKPELTFNEKCANQFCKRLVGFPKNFKTENGVKKPVEHLEKPEWIMKWPRDPIQLSNLDLIDFFETSVETYTWHRHYAENHYLRVLYDYFGHPDARENSLLLALDPQSGLDSWRRWIHKVLLFAGSKFIGAFISCFQILFNFAWASETETRAKLCQTFQYAEYILSHHYKRNGGLDNVLESGSEDDTQIGNIYDDYGDETEKLIETFEGLEWGLGKKRIRKE